MKNLNAHEKLVGVAEDLCPGINLNTATYISFSADRNVAGFQLNGSGNMMLDALPAQPAQAEPDAPGGAVPGDGRQHVLRAGRIEPARRRKGRRNSPLVEPYQGQENPFHLSTWPQGLSLGHPSRWEVLSLSASVPAVTGGHRHLVVLES